ncbi:MAG: hypothetical protein ACOYIH_03830 [Candidatus Fimadaptatus sp.]|jgi:hypothetical protein
MARRIACALCTLLTALLVAGAPHIESHLPVPPRGLTALPYEGWSGVIRLSVHQGFRSGTGSIVPWLNACLSAYEKRHPGVYVQVETVSKAALSRSVEQDIPPDIAIFTPGALDDASRLLPLDMPETVRGDLARACMSNGECRAVPLCFGGYGVLMNPGDMAQLPSDWQEAVQQQYRAATRSEQAHYALQVPGEGRWPNAARRVLGELPEQGDMLPPDYMQCSEVKAMADFKSGRVACIPAGQWQLRQLALAQAQGKAPSHKFIPMEQAYSDMYFAASIVAADDEGAQARAAVCRDIIACLAGEEAQGRLETALLMPSMNGMRLYAQGGDMAALESAYAGEVEFALLFEGG